MKIGHGSISGIQGLRNLETEEILSFNSLIPKFLNGQLSFSLVEFRPGKREGIGQPVIRLHDNLSLTKGLALGFLLR